jgi:hypothetical protein
MGNNILLMMKLETSIFINGLVYFIRKLPILRKRPDRGNFGFFTLKEALGVLSFLYQLVWGSIKAILLPVITVLLPRLIFDDAATAKPLTLILFFYFLLRTLQPYLLELTQTKFILLKELKMDPKDYALAYLVKKESFKLAGRTMGFLLLTGSIFENPLQALVISIAATLIAFPAEAIHLHLFKKKRFLIEEHNWVYISLLLAVMAGGYLTYYVLPGFDGGRILSNPLFVPVLLVLALISLRYILQYDYYMEAMIQVASYEKMNTLQNAMQEAKVADVKMRDKDFKEEDLLPMEGAQKEGFAYLNTLFFKRHRRFFRKPILVKSFIVGGVLLGLFLLWVFSDHNLMNEIGPQLTQSYTMMIFLMYMLTNSNRETKAMFYNCDLFMLRYGFYREPKALLSMFTLRLKRIVLGNLIPTGILILGLVLFTTLSDARNYMEILPLLIMILSLAVFFSVHYLFMYYVFQPYTSSMEVKSPVFSIVNGLVYLLSYLALQIKAPAQWMLPVIIIMSILYTFVAVIFVYKKAPTTFRVK